jgi:ankyrin repeat protein
MMGQTALDLAVANNRDEIIDLLIGAGGICKQVRLWKGKRDGS